MSITPEVIAGIRARHEAEVREPNKWTVPRAEAAHADRATLLLALTEAQERAERAEVKWHNEDDKLPPYGQNVFLLYEAPAEGYWHICTGKLLLGNLEYWETDAGTKLTGKGRYWAFAGDIPLPEGFFKSQPDPNGYVYIHRAQTLKERNDG